MARFIMLKRDILSALVANPHKENCPLDLGQTLPYSLPPASIPLESADSSRRKIFAGKG